MLRSKGMMVEGGFQIKILVLQMGEDDPRKCTSSKLCRMNLAKPIHHARRIPREAIVLNPSVEKVFSPEDRVHLEHGLVAIDCSWKSVEKVFSRRLRGLNRRLPLLLASNPVNYGRWGMLSSAEALGAALYIAGYVEHAQRVLSVFKWGQTFLTLNHDPLEEYKSVETSEKVKEIERDYFPL